ncbi:MAG: hypothetical protein LAP39_18585 [Acidobacteriia bacterium]|nr:hypothetical protein [Terriglobia bacterium]
MNGHFSSQQISRWMIGERTAQEQEHARQCPDCTAQVASLESAIALFRDSVGVSGEMYGRPELPLHTGVQRARRGIAARPSRWAPVAAALLLLAAIPIYTNSRDRRRQAELARADAALLEQVDAGISRAVPAPMEPLVKLVSWNTNGTTKTGATR